MNEPRILKVRNARNELSAFDEMERPNLLLVAAQFKPIPPKTSLFLTRNCVAPDSEAHLLGVGLLRIIRAFEHEFPPGRDQAVSDLRARPQTNDIRRFDTASGQ